MIEAVLFDVGGVLIGPKATAVTGLFLELAATRVPPEVAARSFAVADRAAHDDGVALSDEHGWVQRWAQALHVDDAVAESVHQRIANSPELTSQVWSEVNPEAFPAMDRIRRSGFRIGMVSQSDGHLQARLQTAGLAHSDDVVVDSGLVCWDKPDPEIYRFAAACVGSPLARCAFLSDVMMDVLGAERAGCTNVSIYDPHGVWNDAATPRMASLGQFVSRCLRPL
ncbi:HAD family hydrolase [Streptomyces sp. NPDC020747]|uniref:HAD family hydrolase n=1 Tax=Streptomyces sp. NPDC020747 TaxID=3365086 RepID=UPI00378FB6DB